MKPKDKDNHIRDALNYITSSVIEFKCLFCRGIFISFHGREKFCDECEPLSRTEVGKILYEKT